MAKVPGRSCSIDGCGRSHYARGWCQLHYKRWRRHGDPSVGDRVDITSKVCPGCGVDLPLDRFSVSSRGLGGRAYYCRPCAAVRRREYYSRTASDQTRAMAAERQRVYLQDPANAARSRANSRAWAKANPKIVKERNRAWRAANPEKVRETSRRSRRRNPAKGMVHVHRRLARIAGAPVNDFTAEDWAELLEEFEHRCGYCLAGGVPLQREHMTPLSRGGSNTRSNVIPACGPCNNRKGTRTLLGSLEVLA